MEAQESSWPQKRVNAQELNALGLNTLGLNPQGLIPLGLIPLERCSDGREFIDASFTDRQEGRAR